MGKTAWLIIAALLVVVGILILLLAVSSADWDFTKFGTGAYETETHDIIDKFTDISIKTNTADIAFIPTDDEKCSVVCYEKSNQKHSVEVNDGTLAVNVVDTRRWYEYIGINFGTPKITVYIPRGEYSSLSVKSDTGDVEIPEDFSFQGVDISVSTGHVTNYASASQAIRIKTSTGDIFLEGISAGSLDLSVTTGKVTVTGARCDGDVRVKVSTGKASLTDVTCKSLISEGSTGDIFLKSVIASERFSIERDTGDVRLDASDAGKIFIETDTGDVTGTLLSEKNFDVETDTGRKDVPDTHTGGRCEISTDTGDIRISILWK